MLTDEQKDKLRSYAAGSETRSALVETVSHEQIAAGVVQRTIGWACVDAVAKMWRNERVTIEEARSAVLDIDRRWPLNGRTGRPVADVNAAQAIVERRAKMAAFPEDAADWRTQRSLRASNPAAVGLRSDEVVCRVQRDAYGTPILTPVTPI